MEGVIEEADPLLLRRLQKTNSAVLPLTVGDAIIYRRSVFFFFFFFFLSIILTERKRTAGHENIIMVEH